MMRVGPILFVSHPRANCGVYEFGFNVAEALQASRLYEVRFVECADAEALSDALASTRPVATIFNYHVSTMPWLRRRMLQRHHIPHIGIFHEVTQEKADAATNDLFDFHIGPDPTLLLRNPIVFKTGRLLPRYETQVPVPSVTTIGTFGFGTPGKGFEALVARVQQEFDQAIIRMNIPYAAFGDADGSRARAIAERCRQAITKPGVSLEISHDFLDTPGVLDFLARSSLNAFFYEPQQGRGISSTVDYALAVKRPLALTNCSMFRHVLQAEPGVCVDNSSLRDILNRGFGPLQKCLDEWTAENIVWEYDQILAKVLKIGVAPEVSWPLAERWAKAAPPPVRSAARQLEDTLRSAAAVAVPTLRRVKSALASSEQGARVLGLVDLLRPAGPVPVSAGPAAQNGMGTSTIRPWAGATPAKYEPIAAIEGLNRSLDASAAEQYRPTATYLQEVANGGSTGAADVRSSFVFDTAMRFARQSPAPAVLCVNGYGDAACAALTANGYRVDVVDPIFNYDLTAFLAKPSTRRSHYDVAFVAPRLADAAQAAPILKDLENLLAPGGIGILTLADDSSGQSSTALRASLAASELVAPISWSRAPGPATTTFVFRRNR